LVFFLEAAMSGPDLKKLIVLAAACLAAVHATAQQAPLPVPAEIDATKPKGDGNANKPAEAARQEAIRRAAIKKCDDLRSAAERSACAAQADADKARGGANSDASLPDKPAAPVVAPNGQAPDRNSK